jgi:hypothetical protein
LEQVTTFYNTKGSGKPKQNNSAKSDSTRTLVKVEEEEEENTKLFRVLRRFLSMTTMDPRYHLCYGAEVLEIVKLLDPLDLSIEDR